MAESFNERIEKARKTPEQMEKEAAAIRQGNAKPDPFSVNFKEATRQQQKAYREAESERERQASNHQRELDNRPAWKKLYDTNQLNKEYDALKLEQKNNKETGMKKGGSVSSASKRADGCAQRGKTKGRML